MGWEPPTGTGEYFVGDGERGGRRPPEQTCALAVAMADPFRSRLLSAVAENSNEGLSIRQVAERIKAPRRKVRYHLDALHELGLVGIASRRSRGGVVERFYRVEQMPGLSREELEERDEGQARQIATQVLKAVLADASLALEAKVFGRRPGHTLIRVPAEVDEQGWGEIAEIQERAWREAEKAIGKSRDRLRATGPAPITVLMALLLFEMPPWPSP